MNAVAKRAGPGKLNGTRPKDKKDGNDLKDMNDGFIPPHGGYEKLLSYQKAVIIYDGTVKFCERFFDRYDRTVDQMVQAARSGKQNIVEGSSISGVSKEGELKLTGVAPGSLKELLDDYRDFIRTNKTKEWPATHRYALRLRVLCRKPNPTYEDFRKGIEHKDPAIAANVMIGLIKVTTYLLDRQIEQLEKAFLKEAGIRERMTQARLRSRLSPASSAKRNRPWK